MLKIKEFYFKVLAWMFPKNVWCVWERNFEKEYAASTKGIKSGVIFYKNMTPDSIDVKTDWRTKAVKGKRHELIFLGETYIRKFPVDFKHIFIR